MLLFAVMISSVGCSWISAPPKDEDPTDDIPSYGCVADLPDSITQAQSVKINSFTSAEREESDMTLEEAVSKVKRSSVAIKTDVGSGSGTIIDIDDGKNEKNVFYVLTCHHVIENAATVAIYVPDLNYRYGENEDYTFIGAIGGERTKTQAVSLVGGDFKSDVAVLKLYIADDQIASTIVKAKIMSSEYSCVEGETVFAVGNPTGVLPGSVTSGVISYVNRNTTIDDIGDMTLLQIGVIISPGSSGGALFNLYGELVGMTNAGNATKFTFYAIPHRITEDADSDFGFINVAKQLIATCTEDNYGYISGRKDVIGFTVTLMQGSYSTTYVSVTMVETDSQAEKQGLKIGDVITHLEINGVKHEITTVSGFSSHMDALKPGDKFTIHVLRSSQAQKVDITIYQQYFKDTGIYDNTKLPEPEVA